MKTTKVAITVYISPVVLNELDHVAVDLREHRNILIERMVVDGLPGVKEEALQQRMS